MKVHDQGLYAVSLYTGTACKVLRRCTHIEFNSTDMTAGRITGSVISF